MFLIDDAMAMVSSILSSGAKSASLFAAMTYSFTYLVAIGLDVCVVSEADDVEEDQDLPMPDVCFNDCVFL